MQIAFILPSSVVIGWLDGGVGRLKLHQLWPAIAGVVFGGAAGLVYVMRLAMDAVNNAGECAAKNRSENEAATTEDDRANASAGRT